MNNQITPLDMASTLERMSKIEGMSLLSEGFDKDLGRLKGAMEAYIKDLEDKRTEEAKKYCRDWGYDIDNYGARQVRVSNSDMYITVRAPSAVKFVDGSIDDIDPQFVKVEKKLDTATINAYRKLHGKMPEGVIEEMRGGGSVTIVRKEERVEPKVEQIENPLKGVKFNKR